VTDTERLLLLVVADALRNAPSVPTATRQRIAALRRDLVLDNEAPQGSQRRWVCPRCGHDLETSIALLGPPWADKPPDPNA